MDLPLIGLGTWDLKGSQCTQAVKQALKLGYHHIDTAHIYENHLAIRKGIQGFDRSRLFLTSKIHQNEVDPVSILTSIEKACDLALKELGTDYLDLYLIHWPEPSLPLEKLFKAMETLVLKGKAIRVGVSNFTLHHLEDLKKQNCHPFANQVEFHPFLYQKQLLDYCHSHQIELIAYRSFGKGDLLKEPVFDQIGKRYGKTAAQVILRWLVQHKIPSIPKASTLTHLKENLEIFDFTLSSEEMRQLNSLHQGKRFCKADSPVFEY